MDAASLLGKIVTERLLAVLTRWRMFRSFRGAIALLRDSHSAGVTNAFPR